MLIGVGATAVNAYLAEAAIADRHARGLFPGFDLATCLARFKEAINQGLLKVMSKMGISIISSYRGGYNFEAVGLSRSLCREYFPGLTTRISGIGLTGIKKKVRELHARAFAAAEPPLAIGGFYRYRRGGETHTLEAKVIHQLQHAVATDSYHAFKQYTELLQAQDPISIRDLLDFNRKLPPVPLDEVESITEIRKRFVTPGMSLGALSPEAHETLTIAMNRIGARSDSGEGGEGQGALPPAPQRRQRQLADQAGGLGPLRRHRRVPQRRQGAGDQGRPGGQARRGRPAARLQGHARHRPPAPRHARRVPDLAAAAPRHLLDRGPGPAHLRPEADQPRRPGRA